MNTILELVKNPDRWQAMSQAGCAASPRFTYERYLVALDDMLQNYYGASPLKAEVIQSLREELAR